MTAMPYWSEPGIFNVLDKWVTIGAANVGLTANSVGAAAQNTTVLQGIIDMAQGFAVGGTCPGEPYGAIILFPGHTVVPSPVNNSGGAPDTPTIYYFAVPTGQNAAVTIAVSVC
jgi:hypothetical protein